MEFYHRSNKPKTIPMPECSQYEPTYSLVIDEKTGKKELKKSGKTNIYEKIQAAKDECDIYKILERYENGNVDVINKVQGIYADITNMPRNLAEAQNLILKTENEFAKLPKEIKEAFNNSSSEFITKIANGEADNILKKYKKVEDKQQESNEEQGGIKYE